MQERKIRKKLIFHSDWKRQCLSFRFHASLKKQHFSAVRHSPYNRALVVSFFSEKTKLGKIRLFAFCELTTQQLIRLCRKAIEIGL